MADRLLQPDMTLANPMQTKAYTGNGSGGVDTSKDAKVKDFNLVEKFSAKAFDTKQFDAKNFWHGDFQFNTKAAAVKADAASEKTYGTKTVPVKDARDSGKNFDAAQRFATRDAPITGKTSQDHLEEKYKGQKSQMSIDQVRDLLNKPPL